MMLRLIGLSLIAACIAAPADASETDEVVSRQLFVELLAPVSEAARSVSAAGIAVRGMPTAAGPEQSFFEAVGDQFLAEGFDVWVVREGEPVPTGVLALDMELTASEIDYPEQTRQFLGLGRAQVQRRVVLGAHMRLTDPEAGRLLYNAEPVHVQREWMSFSDANSNAARRPDWMGAQSIQDMRGRNPWWQRGLVVAIVGGVVVLYFGGST